MPGALFPSTATVLSPWPKFGSPFRNVDFRFLERMQSFGYGVVSFRSSCKRG
jgi:hypothetical protein